MATSHLRHWSTGLTHSGQLFLSRSTNCKRLDTKFFSTSCLRSSARSTSAHAHTSILRPPSRVLSFLFDLRHSRPSLSTEAASNPSTVWTRWYRAKNDALATRARLAAQRASRKSSGTSFGSQNPFVNWFNRLPSNIIVWGILGLNGAVYMAWQYAADQARAGNSSLYVTMYKNVLLSWRNIREGRIWTIITSTFSHSSASHFLMNALTFYFMAPPVVHMLGNSAFLGLYFLGGVSCSALSLLLNQSLRKRDGASNGASGAIYAVMSFFACVSPNTKFLIFFVLPVPAWAVVTGFLVWDGYSAITDRRTTIDGAGHVGGILAGAAYYFFKARFRF